MINSVATVSLRNSYGEPTYWDERYENSRREHGQNHSFDFYVKPERIIELVELHIGKDRGARVLVLGCGNSKLSEAIADKGYKSVSYMRGGGEGFRNVTQHVSLTSLTRPLLALLSL